MNPPHLPVKSHDEMRALSNQIFAMFPVGSDWYFRRGDIVATVLSHDKDGVWFRNTAQAFSFKNCKKQIAPADDRHLDFSYLLNYTIMRVEEVKAIGVKRCIDPPIEGAGP